MHEEEADGVAEPRDGVVDAPFRGLHDLREKEKKGKKGKKEKKEKKEKKGNMEKERW